jgi:ribonuclease BN (tRNA processing enzyme)
VRLRVLGCSGAELPGHHLSGFLLDDTLLLDAGTVGAVLTGEEQWRIRDILVTHPHLDHICGIPLLADNILVTGSDHRVNVVSTGEVIGAISAHLMNGIIWPDFAKIPSPESPVISYTEIFPEQAFYPGEFAVTAYRVNHTVPAVGYRITKGATTLLYTGDTGPTHRIWEVAGDLSALIVEVSFPSELEEIALLTRHLTPRLLENELAKLGKLPPRILITHMKPKYHDRIKAELDALAIPGIEILSDGNVYDL